MLIEEGELNDERVHEIKWCSAALYIGNLSEAIFRAPANVETQLAGADTVWLLVLGYSIVVFLER
jgi:hypothetical protein